eukprot:5411136-Pleurochrysis_carterae.AAC.1
MSPIYSVYELFAQTAVSVKVLSMLSCNTTCYKRDTCHTKWHRVASFGAPAKAKTNIGSKFKVADMFPTHQRRHSDAQSCIHAFENTRPTAPKIAT